MEEKKISVSDLVAAYTKLSSTKLKDELLNAKIKVIPYVNYGTKCFLAEKIIEASSKKDNFIKIDSAKRYILYIFSLINTYTNIEINENTFMAEYDLLESNNMIDPILSLISDREKKTFNTVLQMKQDDLMTNEYEIHAYVNNLVKGLYPAIGDTLSPLLSSLNDFVQGLDENKILDIAKKISKLKK